MTHYEHSYLRHMQALLVNGHKKQDRTGTGTLSLFGHQIRHDLRHGFPLLTTKKVFLKGVIAELLWFISGSTNIKPLQAQGVHIWDEWADEDGELGPVYGAMWRNWPKFDEVDDGSPQVSYYKSHIDQLGDAVAELLRNPTSRRLIVSGWNPALLPDPRLKPHENAARGLQALPPCHTLWQLNAQTLSTDERAALFVDEMRKGRAHTTLTEDFLRDEEDFHRMADEEGVPAYYLDLQLYQRSADWFLGVPFNAASYSLLLMMIAKIANMVPRYFIHTFGDTHLYLNHLDQAREQLSRDVRPMPQMHIFGHQQKLEDFVITDFELTGYDPHPAIKAPVSV